MNVVRKLFLSVSTFMLVITLLLINVTLVVKNTVANREVVKTIVKDSGFYENIIDEIVKNVEKEIKNDNPLQEISQQAEQIGNINQNIPQENNSENTGPDIDVAILGRAANVVFTPENIQQKLEAVLDGTYNWLDGDTPDLQFILDLSQEKIALASSLASEATTRVGALPACTADQLAVVNDVDVFSIECLPPEVNSKIAEFQQEFANSDEFLSDVVLSANDIKVNVDGVEKPISEAIPRAPSWYQFANQVIWFMLIAALIWILLIVFLSKSNRVGVKIVGIVFLVASILTLTTAVTTTLVTRSITISGDSFQRTIVVPLIRETGGKVAGIDYVIAAAYAGVFAAAMLYLYLTKPKIANLDEGSDQNPYPVQDTPADTRPEIKDDKLKDSETEKEPVDKKTK